MKKYCLLLFFMFFAFASYAQQEQESIKSPAEFLGYPLGTHFTSYQRISEYFSYIAKYSDNVHLEYYGESEEQRPLFVAFVGSKHKIDSLEYYRVNNRRNALLEKGMTLPNDSTVTVWLSYNVHGNEASSSEVAMKMVHGLVESIEQQKAEWSKNTIVVIDPCLNPDGREHYVSWYKSTVGRFPNPSRDAEEHHEPWPTGRYNHYMHDLNRDWVWQTQKESKERVKLFLSWMPQLHLDFHEQYPDSPYYFAPAAEPFHAGVTDWQRKFQHTFGEANAKHFDQQGWLYFTKEFFDLLYPGYGDTYPTFNGSIGMTMEQAGHGIAGLLVERKGDSPLSLKDRIAHHYQSGWTAIEVASAHSKEIVSEFHRYFTNGKQSPKGKYKSYVLKMGNNPHRLEKVRELLDHQDIQYGRALVNKSYRGFNYLTGKDENFKLDPTDIIISAYQPKSALTNALFEPKTYLSDSLTYDITAWSIPYAYNIPAYASTEKIFTSNYFQITDRTVYAKDTIRKAVSYAVRWNCTEDVSLLSALLQEDIHVKFARRGFKQGALSYDAGTLLIPRQANSHIQNEFDDFVLSICEQYNVKADPVYSGFAQQGADLGSGNFGYLFPKKIAILRGRHISPTSYGSLWDFMDKDAQYPFSAISTNRFSSVSLNKYNVLILPDGSYQWMTEAQKEKLHRWVKNGGKVIAIEGALNLFRDQEGYQLKTYNSEENKEKYAPREPLQMSYADRSRNQISDAIQGAIFRVKMDNTHPLAYGYTNTYFTIKNSTKRNAILNKGWNVGTIDGMENKVGGFVGYRVQPTLSQSLIVGEEEIGKGSIIYFADDPLFRSFWYSGKLMVANAIFMVGQ